MTIQSLTKYCSSKYAGIISLLGYAGSGLVLLMLFSFLNVARHSGGQIETGIVALTLLMKNYYG